MYHSRWLLTRSLPVIGLTLGLSLLAAVSCFAEEAVEAAPAEQPALPGAEPHPAELAARMHAAVEARGADYEPRTEHRRPDGKAVYTNRLIFEDSPYLIQHAHNPVNWYAWGDEAFERAKREDKPVFLSIGYSTCHWCHVMERESFESEEIAKVLNEKFVCIKIDRERRPDIDEIYMTAIHLQRNRGGWPMSSFLTPEGKPFFGGTYFPPDQFLSLLSRVEQAWLSQRTEILASADRLADAVREVTAARGEAQQIGLEALDKAVEQIVGRHDAQLGGFGSAPKFPQEPELLFLLGRLLRAPHPGALAALEKSLDAMARGGIYDQVGGGFHRYSTDAKWLVPHFEKMLYNQAHLSRAYLEAHRLTHNAFFGRVARQTLDYVLREMTAPGGGFYSATDADSEGEEGLFFIWTPAELKKTLDAEAATLAIELFGVTEAGNFEGHNILNLPLSLEEYAARKGMKLGDLLNRVDHIRETLWREREKRIHPIRDDKVLTAWNGMMITALATGYEVLRDDRYLAAAKKSAEFLWNKNVREEGQLWRVHLGGSSSIPAVQEDYAYYAEALLALYDQSGEEVWLERAREVAGGMLEHFWDDDAGGFFMSASQGNSRLIARPKSPSDGAIPSGNSVAVRVLGRLAARTGETLYAGRANAALTAFSSQLQQHPSGYAYMLLGADEIFSGEVGPRQYAAAGTLQAMARTVAEGDHLRVDVDLRIRDGWHVNAHKPLQRELLPTVLEVATEGESVGDGWTLRDVVYPAGQKVELGFQDEPLLVYEGTVRLSAVARPPPAAAKQGPAILPLRLKVQVCNDEICLRPEDIHLEVPASFFR